MARPISIRITGKADFSDAIAEVKGFGSKVSSIFQGVGQAAGQLLANKVGSAFGSALEFGAITDKLGAQLGLAGRESERYGKIASSLFKNAYGDGLADVSQIVADAVALDIPTGDIERISSYALSMGEAFGGAAAEYLQLADQLREQGVTSSVVESLDLITSGFAELPSTMRVPLTQAVNEYGVFAKALGFSSQEIFAGFSTAARSGEYVLDKFSDALKEFGIRATDGSKATSDAFAAMGITGEANINRLSNSLLAGGDSARTASQEIIDGLLGIEDPSKQAQAAIALFGAPIEDLSVSEIPAFLASLGAMGEGMDDVGGAAKRLDKDLNDNLKTRLEGFRRQGLVAFATVLRKVVIPAIDGIVNVFRGPFTAAVAGARELFSHLAQDDRVVSLFNSISNAVREGVTTFKELGAQILALFPGGGGGVMDGLVNAIGRGAAALEVIVNHVGDFFRALRGNGEVDQMNADVVRVANAVRAFGRFLIDEALPAIRTFISGAVALFREWWPQIQPIVAQIGELIKVTFKLIATVIGTTLKAIQAIWSKWGDDILAVGKVAFEAVAGVIKGALDIVIGIVKIFSAALQGDWSLAWEGIKQVASGAWEIIKSLVRLGWEIIKGLFRTGKAALDAIWGGLWELIKAAARAAWSGIQAAVSAGWDRIKARFTSGAEAAKSSMSDLWRKLRTFVLVGMAYIRDQVSSGWDRVIGIFRGLPGRILGAVRGLFEPIYNAFKGVVDKIRNLWSSLSFSVPSIGGGGGPTYRRSSTTGSAARLRKLRGFSTGNVARETTVGVFGEYPGANYNPEITTPQNTMESSFRKVLRQERQSQSNYGQRAGIHIDTIITQPGRDLATELDIAARLELDAA